jgi:predicted dehydrogenase
MRVGIIGTGFGLRTVAPAFAETADCTVVDVVSARDDSAVDQLVQRSDVDLVSVHSPPILHAAHVRAALRSGKAVLCDKPFAMHAEEAAALEAEARAAGLIAICNFEFRCHPARVLLREIVGDGTLGEVEHVQWTHSSSGTREPLRPWGWLFDRALGGGWIGAWASHAVDALRFVLRDEIVDARALLRIDIPTRFDVHGARHECTAEDGLTATLTMQSGATVAIDSTFAAVTTVAPRLTVFGTRAVVEVVADARCTVRRPGTEPGVRDLAEGTGDRHAEPMRRFAEVVRDVMSTGDFPETVPTFADGYACDLVLDRLRAQPFAPRRA